MIFEQNFVQKTEKNPKKDYVTNPEKKTSWNPV